MNPPKIENLPSELISLIESFDSRLDEIKSPSYKEARIRSDFLDKLFILLGWDLSNQQNLSEIYREVIIEDSMEIEGYKKAPDYAFCLGGKRKFFVEAKKPSENLQVNKEHAYQLRRYGWSAKLPICLLTDFEEFAIYDCRFKPSKDDAVTKGLLMYFKYSELQEKWSELSGLFSKEAVQIGLLDQFAENSKSKHGTLEVDKAFLQEIDGWRNKLAKNIAKNNPSLDIHGLNYSVQQIIDRIIFLRICEDRGAESYASILMPLKNGNNIYKRLVEKFEQADEKYNSGLFHFSEERGETTQSDRITPNLIIDDQLLKDIFSDLYYPESPYAFSQISADILGQIYEQFLGKVISLNNQHEAIIEEKPEVRKAGGVYYTPTYIVEYIIKNTLGKLLIDKTPTKVAKIKVLDPACGSGSFLIQAYQYLLDWHLIYYLNKENFSDKLYKGKNPILFQDMKGDWVLTTAEKKRILLNNIFGVDIDLQAVEVTKLSLLLKVLEGESEETLRKTISFFHERVLPDLGKNIKCGNSLISTDFYNEGQISLFSDMQYRINAFDWNLEFREVMVSGGFTIIIGNPPYVFGGNYGINDIEKKYFKSKYVSGTGKINLFTLLVEKSLELLNSDSELSFIIPNTFLRVTSYEKTREFVLKNSHIKEIVDLGTDVFKNATTSSIIIDLKKQNQYNNNNQIVIKNGIEGSINKVKQAEFNKGSFIFNINNNPLEFLLLSKLRDDTINLGILCEDLIFGVVITKNRDQLVSNSKHQGFKPFLEGKDIGRYVIYDAGKFINYVPSDLHRPRTPEIFEAKEKLLIQRITGGENPLKVAYDNNQYYNKESINNLILKNNCPYDIKYILGLLNSKIINWFYSTQFTNASKLTVNISKEYLSQIPIKKIDFESKMNTEEYNKIIMIVDSLIELNSAHYNGNIQNRELLVRQINSLDNSLDQLFYKLYNLTPEEIRIVERNSSDVVY